MDSNDPSDAQPNPSIGTADSARVKHSPLADVVRRYRLARNWSQGQLALYAGLSRSFVTKLEQGQYQTAEPPTLQKIASALQAPLGELLTAAGITAGSVLVLTDLDYSPVLIQIWPDLSTDERAAIEGYAQALWDRKQPRKRHRHKDPPAGSA